MPAVKIPHAEFVLSCPRVELSPKLKLPEIAFAGRSNVGKSSLINSLLNRKRLALTARTPGKTRLLNYFKIGGNLCYFVDLPGYGYAKVSKEMQAEWGDYIEAYLRDSTHLKLVVLILDIRHGPTELDRQMINALSIFQRSWIAVMTKSDKLSNTKIEKALSDYRGMLISLGAENVLPYSSLNHSGRDEILTELLQHSISK
ncbi:ribosome biogenesis GTP-binding protein YihA/YsxC [bacterium]|nr:ribosome biogenesis GTP-binding protein YihA/YsxC [bacterium]MBU1637852.1 ribosome biogenesis GTP-binding protein YihA/YsxC [bacterium]MBU1919517.1 ribosome biogenesis GTP-binding protein YihA/YsxC [bacterium]